MSRLPIHSLAAVLGALAASSVSAPARADETRSWQRGAFGVALSEYDDPAAYTRAEIGIGSDDGSVGFGLELWRGTEGALGIGVPGLLRGCLGSELVLCLGGGLDLVHADRTRRRWGVGLLAPFALVELGVVLPGDVRLGVEAKPEYRWKSFGTAPEQGQLALGGVLVVPLEAR